MLGRALLLRVLLSDDRTRSRRRHRTGPASADAGARLTLGSDQNAIIDPFVEARGWRCTNAFVSGERGRFSLDELGNAMSRTGYASIGWPDGGVLTVGAH